MDNIDQVIDLNIVKIHFFNDNFFNYDDTFDVRYLVNLYVFLVIIVHYNILNQNQVTNYVEFVFKIVNYLLLIIFDNEPYYYFTEYVELNNLVISLNNFKDLLF